MKISELKTHLSAALKKVQKGIIITVFDRNVPVAEIHPCAMENKLKIRKPVKSVRKLKPAVKVQFDPVETLLSDRQSR